jgi:hypothetical protein
MPWHGPRTHPHTGALFLVAWNASGLSTVASRETFAVVTTRLLSCTRQSWAVMQCKRSASTPTHRCEDGPHDNMVVVVASSVGGIRQAPLV